MNLYDFDKTIYKKDSAIKFYAYCFWRSLKMILHLIYACFFAILHFFHIISTKVFKEKFFSFLKFFKDPDSLVYGFWDKEQKNINAWYSEIKRDDDVICSASPEFLLRPIIDKINPRAVLVCTQMDIRSGKIDGENLKGENKKYEKEVLEGI